MAALAGVKEVVTTADLRGGDHWGERRGGVHSAAAWEEEEAVLGRCTEGGRKARWAVWAKRLNRPVGGWADWVKIWRKILFRIKIGFLNIPRL
jgi:hypothetical protein